MRVFISNKCRRRPWRTPLQPHARHFETGPVRLKRQRELTATGNIAQETDYVKVYIVSDITARSEDEALVLSLIWFSQGQLKLLTGPSTLTIKTK